MMYDCEKLGRKPISRITSRDEIDQRVDPDWMGKRFLKVETAQQKNAGTGLGKTGLNSEAALRLKRREHVKALYLAGKTKMEICAAVSALQTVIERDFKALGIKG